MREGTPPPAAAFRGPEIHEHDVSELSGFLPLRADQVPRWLLEEDTSDFWAWTDWITEWDRNSLLRS